MVHPVPAELKYVASFNCWFSSLRSVSDRFFQGSTQSLQFFLIHVNDICKIIEFGGFYLSSGDLKTVYVFRHTAFIELCPRFKIASITTVVIVNGNSCH